MPARVGVNAAGLYADVLARELATNAKPTPFSFAGGKLGATLVWPGFWRVLGDARVRRLIGRETDKSLRLRAICREASALVPTLRRGQLMRSYAGNRAQLISRDGKLVEDLVVRETNHAIHVLNAVSPGLTCSLPFGEYLAGLAARKL